MPSPVEFVPRVRLAWWNERNLRVLRRSASRRVRSMSGVFRGKASVICLAQPNGLIVPHKYCGKKKSRIGAEGNRRSGQVVDSLRSDPQAQRAALRQPRAPAASPPVPWVHRHVKHLAPEGRATWRWTAIVSFLAVAVSAMNGKASRQRSRATDQGEKPSNATTFSAPLQGSGLSTIL